MVQYIKSGKTVNEKRDIDQQVAKTVETILADIEARGWAAIRDYSEKFDKWNPKTFKLSAAEIQACMGSLTAQVSTDSEPRTGVASATKWTVSIIFLLNFRQK